MSSISIIGYILFFMLSIEIAYMVVVSSLAFIVLSYKNKSHIHMQSLLLLIAYFLEGCIIARYIESIPIWIILSLVFTTYFSGYDTCSSYDYELNNK